MKLKSVMIKNFRKIDDIDFKCSDKITTIVGPNGVGKSSVFDAIRVAKSILIPQLENEAQQTLQTMGIFSPHTNSVMFNNICSDPAKEVRVELSIKLSDDEMTYIENNTEQLSMLRLQNKLAAINQSNLNFVSYLSTDEGKKSLSLAMEETKKKVDIFSNDRVCKIFLKFTQGRPQGEDGFHQELIRFLFQKVKYTESVFSFFPADRSFPAGDTNIQLGQGDVAQHLQSHTINPQLKFQRLKTVLVTHVLTNQTNIDELREDFKQIFDRLIPGKKLKGVGVDGNSGKLSVLIEEDNTGAVYDVDFLSSGEKGLLLTLFLLKRTMARGGVVFIDEPELHLNPAVCRDIVPFLKEVICEPQDVQLVLTTHSGSILSSTKNDEDLSLLHFIDSTNISPIYKRDDEEAIDAMRFLGIEASDIIFNKGILYLEGTTDEDFLTEVMRELLSGYKIKSLGGRALIEGEIKRLQSMDKSNKLDGYHVFILDNDNKPTTLSSTDNVKVIQWDRYSFENYLLNEDVLYDVIKNVGASNPPTNRGAFTKDIKDIAFSQLDNMNIQSNYGSYFVETMSLSSKEIKDCNIDDISKLLLDKLNSLEKYFSEEFKSTDWKDKFIEGMNHSRNKMIEDWESKWKNHCRGKQLICDLYNKYGVAGGIKKFMIEVIRLMNESQTEEIQVVVSKLQHVLK